MTSSDNLSEETGHCVLCTPAPHPNCEEYTSVWIEDPGLDLEGEVRVCLEHYEAIERCLKALNRGEA